ncbi:MAG: hypothetical protein ACRDT4_11670 [Micromonosporaceae bacterium]
MAGLDDLIARFTTIATSTDACIAEATAAESEAQEAAEIATAVGVQYLTSGAETLRDLADQLMNGLARSKEIADQATALAAALKDGTT